MNVCSNIHYYFIKYLKLIITKYIIINMHYVLFVLGTRVMVRGRKGGAYFVFC